MVVVMVAPASTTAAPFPPAGGVFPRGGVLPPAGGVFPPGGVLPRAGVTGASAAGAAAWVGLPYTRVGLTYTWVEG